MNFRNFLRTLAVACTFAVASTASATAILQVNSSGILTGATGVNVGGKLYDVKFADGSCNFLFNNCVTSSFTFQSASTAILAAKALLDQVFVDGLAGNFDSTTNKILGCTGGSYCDAFVPYLRTPGTTQVFFEYAHNLSSTVSDTVVASSVQVTSDTGPTYSQATFAVFQLAAPSVTAVPEPSSIALMGLALAALAFARRRKA